MKKVSVFGIILLLIISGYILSSLDQKGLIIKEINMTPERYYDRLPSVLPPEKLKRVYRLVYVAENCELDSQAYLKKHPTDAVEKRSMGSGECHLTIFSNDPPDPDFFQ